MVPSLPEQSRDRRTASTPVLALKYEISPGGHIPKTEFDRKCRYPEVLVGGTPCNALTGLVVAATGA
jgi:hypothetical protein